MCEGTRDRGGRSRPQGSPALGLCYELACQGRSQEDIELKSLSQTGSCIYRLLVNFGCNSISGTVRGGYSCLLFIILWMQDGNTVDKFTYVQETETED